MLNVVTTCTGNAYPWIYVERLEKMVKRHLKRDYTFYTISDALCEPTYSWWDKLNAFDGRFKGHVLLLDLDQIILKDLDTLLDACNPNKLTCYADHISWHGCRLGSAWMFFPADKYKHVWDVYSTNPEQIRKEYNPRGGDQTFINEVSGGHEFLDDLLGYRPVLSYKFDDLEAHEPDDDTFIVNFHGKPKMHDVVDQVPWVAREWR